jgi:hypothetical protein
METEIMIRIGMVVIMGLAIVGIITGLIGVFKEIYKGESE